MLISEKLHCPFCGQDFDPMHEDLFKDEITDDSSHTELECPSCTRIVYVQTHCSYSFSVDTLEMETDGLFEE